MGYSGAQIRDMERTINACECDVVLIATPIDLRRLLKIRKPSVRVGYELEEIGRPKLEDVIGDALKRLAKGRTPAAPKRVQKRVLKRVAKGAARRATKASVRSGAPRPRKKR
jgi:hypothetical protein